MSGVATAVSGATSSHSAPAPPHVAAGARRDTKRKTTGAPWRGARPGRATGVNTPCRSVITAEASTWRRLTPARRRRPAAAPRGGGPPPPSGGSEARHRCQKTHRPAPRRRRVTGRRWKRVRARLRGGHGGVGQRDGSDGGGGAKGAESFLRFSFPFPFSFPF